MTVRLLVVDDHPLVLQGLAGALVSADDLVIVARATTCAEARRLLTREVVDVALVDVRLPDGSGLELVREMRDAGGPACLVLSSFESTQYIATAVDLGASGYVLKTAPIESVIVAIRTAASGGTTFTLDQLNVARESNRRRLTELEREIVRSVLSGRSNGEIAGDLHIATKTVEGYLTRLFARHGVTSRTELALRGEREGWLDVPGPGQDRGRERRARR